MYRVKNLFFFTKEFEAMAALSQGAKLTPFSYTPIPLGNNEVEIEVNCCGVCHSDLHQIEDDWGVANFPLVPGHEVVGIITQIGSGVKNVKVGQRVGVGPQTGSCDNCEECKRGNRNLCAHKVKAYGTPTGNPMQPHTYGGYSKNMRTNADWVFSIPDALSDAETAPLLCAGITTWSPFMLYAKKGDKVAVLGMGGLGHVALQFGVKLGYEVTCISTSSSKEKEAREYGCTGFINAKDEEQMKAAASSFNFILSTISANVDFNAYLNLLKPDGRMCMVGLPSKPMPLKAGPIVVKRLSVCGSYLANRKEIVKMLDFCAKHGVTAKIEKFDFANAQAAIEKLKTNDLRYRAVLMMK